MLILFSWLVICTYGWVLLSMRRHSGVLIACALSSLLTDIGVDGEFLDICALEGGSDGVHG